MQDSFAAIGVSVLSLGLDAVAIDQNVEPPQLLLREWRRIKSAAAGELAFLTA